MLIPKSQRERPPTQIIMAKLINESKLFFICVHGLSPSRGGVKISALDMRKTKAFIVVYSSSGFPNGGFGRQMGRITGAAQQGDRNKVVITTSRNKGRVARWA